MLTNRTLTRAQSVSHRQRLWDFAGHAHHPQLAAMLITRTRTHRIPSLTWDPCH